MLLQGRIVLNMTHLKEQLFVINISMLIQQLLAEYLSSLFMADKHAFLIQQTVFMNENINE